MPTLQQIKDSKLKLNKDIFSLNPSAVISLFVIDISDIAFDYGIIGEPNRIELDESGNKNRIEMPGTVFRFHNNLKLTINSIHFNTDKLFLDNGNDVLDQYIAAPIYAEGFEYSAKGTLPTPKLSLTVQSEGLSELSLLKEQLYKLGDLIGAKVTRIRTLAKYLHPNNFAAGDAPDVLEYDPYAEFPREIYYIDRKSAENKNYIEYELCSILDVQGAKLPRRLVTSTTCQWQYRGEGCNYEYEYRKNLPPYTDTIHGIYGPPNNGADTNYTYLPESAPAVATVNDELIYEILGFRDQSSIRNKGKYIDSELKNYKKGESVYIEKSGIKYYYVCKSDVPLYAPPNSTYWIADQCSKRIAGCKCRWGSNGAAAYDTVANGVGYKKEHLRFGGFPSVQRF